MLPLLRAERRRLLLLPAGQFRFRAGEVAQPGLPFGFQAARDQAVFGFDQSIATFRAFGVVARAFDRESPLREGRVMMGLELLHREQRCVERGRCDGVEEGVRHGLVDREAPDVQAIDATPLDDVLAGAVVPGVACRPR